jgi:RecA-family ATPase
MSNEQENNKTLGQIGQEINAAGGQLPPLNLTPELLMPHIMTQDALNNLSLPPRLKIVGDFAQEGGIGYLFAQRGEGKTWLGLHLGKCIASGTSFGGYEIPRPWPVLYIEGEMNTRSLQDRINMLPNDSGNFHLLSTDLLWSRLPANFKGLNLHSEGTQKLIISVVVMLNIKVLFLDNLSCLFNGMKENEADSWEDIMPFLGELKHRGILIIILHHTTKSGDKMRGTSKREDQADFVVRVNALQDEEEEKDGILKLKTEFTKSRNCQNREWKDELAWTFNFPEKGKATIESQPYSKKQQVLLQISQGVERCKDIAESLYISESKVSRIVRQLIKEGKVKKKGRGYIPDPNYKP